MDVKSEVSVQKNFEVEHIFDPFRTDACWSSQSTTLAGLFFKIGQDQLLCLLC